MEFTCSEVLMATDELLLCLWYSREKWNVFSTSIIVLIVIIALILSLTASWVLLVLEQREICGYSWPLNLVLQCCLPEIREALIEKFFATSKRCFIRLISTTYFFRIFVLSWPSRRHKFPKWVSQHNLKTSWRHWLDGWLLVFLTWDAGLDTALLIPIAHS